MFGKINLPISPEGLQGKLSISCYIIKIQLFMNKKCRYDN
jgi:hypothetical protein